MRFSLLIHAAYALGSIRRSFVQVRTEEKLPGFLCPFRTWTPPDIIILQGVQPFPTRQVFLSRLFIRAVIPVAKIAPVRIVAFGD